MKRICKYCGKEYDGDPGSSCCPDCAAAQRATTLRPRTCRACGVTFDGGPRAWYCPDCRRERRKEADRRHRRNCAAWEAAHRPERNAYQLERYHRRKDDKKD